LRKQYVYLIGVCGLLIALAAGTVVSAASVGTHGQSAAVLPAGPGGNSAHGRERWYHRGALPVTGGPPHLGVPAIQPQVGMAGHLAPAFTTKDVEAYVATHQILARASASGPVVVEKVEFLPTQTVNERLKTTISQADGTLLCLVQLRGTFTAAVPPGAKGRRFAVAYRVFDARTGDLLVEAG